jgi:hypothetical protein
MKRAISTALLFSLFALPVAGLVGCGEETKVEKTETIQTPDGSATKTDSSTLKTTGDNPPAAVPK